jgi:Family of unknown function (DUF6494)
VSVLQHSAIFECQSCTTGFGCLFARSPYDVDLTFPPEARVARLKFLSGEALKFSVTTHSAEQLDDDGLSTGVRQFFRKVRVTAQREIEKAVRDADAKRRLTGTTLPTRAVVTVGGIDLKFDVDGDMELA